jgi:hypothetical protein
MHESGFDTEHGGRRQEKKSKGNLAGRIAKVVQLISDASVVVSWSIHLLFITSSRALPLVRSVLLLTTSGPL